MALRSPVQRVRAVYVCTNPACGAWLTIPQLAKLDTTVSKEHEPGSDDAPQSVIHIPLGFKDFVWASGWTTTSCR